MSNVRTTIKAGNVYTVLGQTGGSDTDIDVEVEPGTWSSTITMGQRQRGEGQKDEGLTGRLVVASIPFQMSNNNHCRG